MKGSYKVKVSRRRGTTFEFIVRRNITIIRGDSGTGKTTLYDMVADYTRRRDILVDGINAVPGFTCAKPKGSFYAFVNIKAFGKSSQEFAEELIRGAHVICVPGTAFGAMGEGYLRLVFANSDENLKEAVRRIDEYVRKAYPDMK